MGREPGAVERDKGLERHFDPSETHWAVGLDHHRPNERCSSAHDVWVACKQEGRHSVDHQLIKPAEEPATASDSKEQSAPWSVWSFGKARCTVRMEWDGAEKRGGKWCKMM